MLILARKTNQSIRIGDNITISVLEIQGDQVRLGISAPKDLQILRQELFDAVKDSNKEALLAVNEENLLSMLAQVKKLKGDKNTPNDEKE
jgi:carbon storage regulator